MAKIDVFCIKCGHKETILYGQSSSGLQRYRCKSDKCGKTFQLKHCYNAYQTGVKERIVDMALNGSGVRDTARVLSVSMNTVMSTLKKSL